VGIAVAEGASAAKAGPPVRTPRIRAKSVFMESG